MAKTDDILKLRDKLHERRFIRPDYDCMAKLARNPEDQETANRHTLGEVYAPRKRSNTNFHLLAGPIIDENPRRVALQESRDFGSSFRTLFSTGIRIVAFVAFLLLFDLRSVHQPVNQCRYGCGVGMLPIRIIIN